MEFKEIIDNFQSTQNFAWMTFGEDYYNSDNTEIMSRKKQYYADGRLYQEHPYKANHKLPSGYLKKIVDQKVQYLLGNGITITDEDERSEEIFKEIFIDELDELVSDVGTTASKKIVGWVQAHIQDGIIKFTEIPPEQIIAFKDGFGNIVKLIRFFNTFDENFKEVLRVEVWDSETVTVHIETADGFRKEEPQAHMVIQSISTTGELMAEEAHSFGRVPFIPMFNNKANTSDLKAIKPFIDIYDIVNSDFANNIDDMQDAFYIIKNYGGENLAEFMEQLKQLKAVPVGDDGDVKTEQLKIPVEARKTFLDLTDMNIFKFGMGVDTTDLTGSSITNVVIKAMFADLDLKADQFEVQVTQFLNNITWFINWWLDNLRNQPMITPKFTYNRSLIVNEVELLKANAEQKGSISEDTRLSNHVWVKNVEDEKELIEEENEMMLNSLDNNMGFNE